MLKKKIIITKIVVSLLLIVLVFLGCSESRNVSPSSAELDGDNYSFYHQGHPITETDTGYFILMNGILHFLDKETDSCVVYSKDAITMTEISQKRLNSSDFKHESIFGDVRSVFYYQAKLYLLECYDYEKDLWQLIEVNTATHERRVLDEFHCKSGLACRVDEKLYMLEYSLYIKGRENDPIRMNQVSPEELKNIMIKYDFRVFNLDNKKVIESIEIPTTSEYLLSEQATPRIQTCFNNIYIDTIYNKGETAESSTKERILLVYNTDNQKFENVVLADYPKNDQDQISSYLMFNDSIYMTKSTFPDLEKVYDRSNVKSWSLQKSDNNEEFKKSHNLNTDDIFTTNGIDLYTVPSAMIELDPTGNLKYKSFEINKIKENELEQVIRIDEKYLQNLLVDHISISSTGDIFIYNIFGKELYLIRDGELKEIINYSN